MSNAFDAQTAWQTRNGIAGAFNLQVVNQSNTNNSAGSGVTTRNGYSRPTPQNNSSNASNSELPMNHGTQTLPHNFSKITEMGSGVISTGTYYVLTPTFDNASPHPAVKAPIWLPVTGDNPVDFSFNHQWDQADNVSKKIADAVSLGLLGGEWGSLAYKQGLHTMGGGPYVSGCAVFNSSSPATISVASKLFSSDGSGSLVELVEKLRSDTHANMAAGGTSNTVGVRGGAISHPGWWKIEVISFADGGSESIIASMKDMICVGLKVTMHSPWVGKDPSLMELRVDFQNAYPGLAQSMAFGKRI